MHVSAIQAPHIARPLRLRPFRGLMLAPHLAGDPATLRHLARPYRDTENRVSTWLADGRLRRDATPGVYIHEYTAGGMTVRGLVAALDVTHLTHVPESRAVWPHEAVHPERVADLAGRMREMHLNPAPILLVHDGRPDLRAWMRENSEGSPVLEATDRSGQHHRIWHVTHPERIAHLDVLAEQTTCVVADGHHRYAAYLSLQAETPGIGWDTGLAMLVDQTETPLHLGAIHRVLSQVGFEDVTAVVRDCLSPQPVLNRMTALARLDPHSLLMTDGEQWLHLNPRLGPNQTVVDWLHGEFLPRLPGHPIPVSYEHQVDGALAKAGPQHVAVLLPMVEFAALERLLHAGQQLPEKTTSFQPKPTVGMIMREVR